MVLLTPKRKIGGTPAKSITLTPPWDSHSFSATVIDKRWQPRPNTGGKIVKGGMHLGNNKGNTRVDFEKSERCI